MGDADIFGHFKVLGTMLEDQSWQEIWHSLDLHCFTFEEFGLASDAPDSEVWHVCQREEVALITANRNKAGPDSLEATLRDHNNASSLPVFTISNAQRFMDSKRYAQRVVEKLLEYLLEIDAYRGTGRLYLP